MTETIKLPSLNPIPDDIGEHIYRLLQQPSFPKLEPWLKKLIRNSGHLSLTDDLRWRLLCMVWLTAEFDAEEGWPYLMWFNQGEPTMEEHLNDMLYEAVNDMLCHVRLAHWIAHTEDEQFKTFFKDYPNLPSQTRTPALLRKLLVRPHHPDVGLWIGNYCRHMLGEASKYTRRWRLLLAAWYATCFDAQAGLFFLKELTNGAEQLPLSDNKLLMDTADEINATPFLMQWIADCGDPAVKRMLSEFGHPNLEVFIEVIFQNPPDFNHLREAAARAMDDAQTFIRNRYLLKELDVPQDSDILNLACGPMAPQTLLLSSIGYSNLLGVDLEIPPAYWPVGFIQRLTRGKYVKAWEEMTTPYYEALTRLTKIEPNWRKVDIKLADVTRLEEENNRFDIVLCSQHLQHEPNIPDLLTEAARVLRPGGLFIADIKPYASLTGAYLPPDTEPPWVHLNQNTLVGPLNLTLNRWREAQFEAAISHHFELEQWLVEQDETAESRLTPEIEAQFSAYKPEELTRAQIIVIARKQ